MHCHGDSIDQLKDHMVLYSFELSLEGVDWGIYLVFSFQQMTKDKEIKLVGENPPPFLWEVGCFLLCIRKNITEISCFTADHWGVFWKGHIWEPLLTNIQRKMWLPFFLQNCMSLLLLKAKSMSDFSQIDNSSLEEDSFDHNYMLISTLRPLHHLSVSDSLASKFFSNHKWFKAGTGGMSSSLQPC